MAEGVELSIADHRTGFTPVGFIVQPEHAMRPRLRPCHAKIQGHLYLAIETTDFGAELLQVAHDEARGFPMCTVDADGETRIFLAEVVGFSGCVPGPAALCLALLDGPITRE